MNDGVIIHTCSETVLALSLNVDISCLNMNSFYIIAQGLDYLIAFFSP